MKNHFIENKKKYVAVVSIVVFLVAFSMGVSFAPTFERMKQNYRDMFGSVTVEHVVYEGNEEQKAIRELMKTDDFQQVAQNMALAIYNKRMAEETMKKAEGYAARKGYNLDKLDQRLSEMMSSTTTQTK